VAERSIRRLLEVGIRVLAGPVLYVLDPEADFSGWAFETPDGRLVAVDEVDGRIEFVDP